MTEQENRFRYIRGHQGEGGEWAPTNSHRGRFGSWVAIAFLIIGFGLSGLALATGLNLWLLVPALLLMLIGAVLSMATDIFTDVVLDDPRYDAEEPHSTPLHKIKQHGTTSATDR